MRRETKKETRKRRHQRIRAVIYGRAGRPRLSVFKSLKHIYAQIIDDEKGKTLVSASEQELSKSARSTGKKIEKAEEIGKLIAKKALEKKIEKVVFDRGSFRYHGRIKALAEGARQGGLKF